MVTFSSCKTNEYTVGTQSSEEYRERAEEFVAMFLLNSFFIPFVIDETIHLGNIEGFDVFAVFATSIGGEHSESMIIFFEDGQPYIYSRSWLP